MTDTGVPPWVDDLFPFPSPAPFRTLVDGAWRHAHELYVANGHYDYLLLATHYDFMFDLDVFPRPLDGWDGYPEFSDDARRPTIPLFATPEFVAFGSLGTGAYVGWLVPAPEIGRPDHPVALADGHGGRVTWIGEDTRAGLEFMLSWTLRRWRERPEPVPPAGADPGEWFAENRYLVDAAARDRSILEQLADELGVRPDPDRSSPGSSWDGTAVCADEEFEVAFEVPDGWRHAPGVHGIGVLAPADTFADRDPVTADLSASPEALGPVLRAASDALDRGHPASALLGLESTFVNSPTCYFDDLRPLWSRAYHDLGRARLAARLDLMAEKYRGLPCYCDAPHRPVSR